MQLFLLLVSAASAAAQDLTLNQAIEGFLSRSPLAEAEKEKVVAAQARLRQSGAWTNPVLTYGQEGYRLGEQGSGFDQQEFLFGLSQEFELGGKRGKRSEVAELELAEQEARYDDFVRLKRLEISRLFVTAYYGLKQKEIAEESLEGYLKICDLHRRRYEAGEVSGLAQIKLEADEIQYVVRTVQAERRLDEAWAELASMIGWAHPGLPGLRWDEPAQADLPAASELIGIALEARPDYRARRLAAQAAEKQVELERASNVPNLTVAGGYKRDFGENSFFLGLQLPLPLWDRREGAIAARISSSRREGMLSGWTRVWIGYEITRAHDRVGRLKKAASRLDARYGERLERLVNLTALNYEAGEAGILEYLDALRVRRDTLLERMELLEELSLAELELEAAIGRPVYGVRP
ncbi:MAG: TolC family protein [Acidobacteriota bacterium]|nr:MAG: TolC family protein [Acidobacteriota bacterium]